MNVYCLHLLIQDKYFFFLVLMIQISKAHTIFSQMSVTASFKSDPMVCFAGVVSTCGDPQYFSKVELEAKARAMMQDHKLMHELLNGDSGILNILVEDCKMTTKELQNWFTEMKVDMFDPKDAIWKLTEKHDPKPKPIVTKK